MMTKTTYDTLPEELDLIHKELMELKNEIFKREKPIKQFPPYLDIDKAVEFLANQGYSIAKSTLYKKTSNREIPFSVFNGRLLFETKELTTWYSKQYNRR